MHVSNLCPSKERWYCGDGTDVFVKSICEKEKRWFEKAVCGHCGKKIDLRNQEEERRRGVEWRYGSERGDKRSEEMGVAVADT